MINTPTTPQIPEPLATMHTQHLKEQHPTPPVTSCRCPSAVVHLLSDTGAHVPVRLRISQVLEAAGLRYVVQVLRVPPAAEVDDKRLRITVDFHGQVSRFHV